MQQTIIFIVVVVLALGVAGYFFYQNQILEAQVSELQDEKTGLEKELVVLKSTDLAKENEILRWKLQGIEKDLASEKKKTQDLESSLVEAKNKIQSLESKISKAKLHFSVLGAFHDWEYKPSEFHILDRDTSAIDSAIAALKDSSVSSLWSSIKANFPRAKETGDFRYGEVLMLINSKISSLLQ